MEFCRTELAQKLGGEVCAGQVVVTHDGRKIHVTDFDSEGKPALTALGKQLLEQSGAKAEPAPEAAPAPAPVPAKKAARRKPVEPTAEAPVEPAPAPVEAAPAPVAEEAPVEAAPVEVEFEDVDLSDLDVSE